MFAIMNEMIVHIIYERNAIVFQPNQLPMAGRVEKQNIKLISYCKNLT